jgi:nuclear pore complex protein Nup188
VQSLIPSLQSLVAVISLSLIDCQRSLESFFDPDVAQIDQAGPGYTSYISDLQTIGDLHKIILDAASGLSPVASPAVLAWSIILKAMRETSMARKEARELRQSVRAEEALEDDASFDEDIGSTSRIGRPWPGRRFSVGSESSAEVGIYDEFLESIKDMASDEDPIQYLAFSAIDGSHVFDVLASLAVFFGTIPYANTFGSRIRLVILTLTRCSIEVMDYTPEIINTTLAALTGNRTFWDLAESQPAFAAEDPLVMFLGDDYFGQKLLHNAMARYPYESLPFLKIVHAIAACQTLHDEGIPVALRPLERMPSFTFQLSQNFREYETIQEEDNANTIQLTRDVLLFQPRKSMRLTSGQSGRYSTSITLAQVPADFSIPRGTPGRIVSDSDSGPKVAIWFQEYSGLKYMGKLLETILTASEYVDATTGEVANRESVAEMIGLLATLLLTSTKIEELGDSNVEPHASAYRILEDASDGLDRNRDIVTVIFKIFEEELQRQSAGLDNDASLDILVASIQFIYALVPVLPSRVWPLLGRSKLLEIDGQGGMLSSILARIEIVTCRYDFLLSCTHLFHALIEDSVRHALRRKAGSKSLVRHGSKEDQGTGVPEQTLSKILSSYTRTLVDVLESACNWRFVIQEQRLELSELISRGFNNILYYTHGVDDSSRPEVKLTKSLMPAAQYIIEAFLSTTSGHLRFRPILQSFINGVSAPEMSIQSTLGNRSLQEVRASLSLTITLMKLAVLVDRPKSQLENQLFKISPLIARLYAVHESYRILVVKLLEALVLCASSREEEPPSLLGHLGRKTSKNFIHLLLELDKPLDDDSNVIAIWHLMSVVISSRQQWFSIYLLTGRPPRETLKETKLEKPSAPAKMALKIALDTLSNIQDLPMPRATAMLEFVSLAQNYWPWAMSDLHLKQSNFIKSISEFVSILAPVPASASEERMMEACYQSRMAAYIAEILAMYLYHSRQLGKTAPVTDVLPQIEFYTRCAVSAPSYNSSLHGNLKRNFAAMFSGCSLQDFKRTRLEVREFGREYFYDINFADKMLNSDLAWIGRKNDGLAEELAKANINLSLVDAQVVSIQVIHAGH